MLNPQSLHHIMLWEVLTVCGGVEALGIFYTFVVLLEQLSVLLSLVVDDLDGN